MDNLYPQPGLFGWHAQSEAMGVASTSVTHSHAFQAIYGQIHTASEI